MSSKTSPMLAQYLEIKDKHPGCLLFFRMGDFYELFFEDAREAAAALDIALTKRNKSGDDDIPMCGVPVHSHESYLERLIRQGFRVAICEQIESPEEARKRPGKTLVRRDVVRIVTPGTVTEERLLNARESNLLMAVSLNGDELGLAYADISTGTFVTELIQATQFGAALSRLLPAEVILPEVAADLVLLEETLGAHEQAVISRLPAQSFALETARNTLLRVCGVQHLDGAGDLDTHEWCAAGGLASYLEKTQKQAIGHFPLPVSQRRQRVMAMDQATRRSLELNRTQTGEKKGSLLWALDKTQTGPGGRKLSSWLAAPLMDHNEINRRLDRVESLMPAVSPREPIRDQLRRCPDMERALGRMSAGRAGPRDYGAIRDGLAASRELMAEIEVAPPLHALFEPLQFPTDLFQALNTLLVDELPVQDKDGGVIRTGAAATLDALRSDATGGRQRIAALQAQYQEHTGIPGLRIKHNNLIGFFIEIQAQHRDRVPDDFVQRQSMANATRYHTEELLALAERLETAGDQARALEREMLDQLRQQILDAHAAIRAIADSRSELDVTAALAELAVAESYTRPELDDTSRFLIHGGRHPVVEQMLRRDNQNFIANDCDLSEGGRLWLLTGPNMAGKSTYLRQNALIAIMAQIGSFVPAESAQIGLIDRVFSRVGAADDLARGRSTFMVEMTETAAILNTATPRSLVILDEIGRGTATFDGLSLAWAVVEYLHDQLRCRGLFATHYHELTQLADKLAHLACSKMMVKEWRGEIRFLHQVAGGAADRSYGIHVARLAGLPQPVIRRAAAVLKRLEQSESAGNSRDIAKDMPLFDLQDTQVTTEEETMAPDGGVLDVLALLDELNPDEMTPRLALDALYRLKAQRDETSS